MYTGLLVLLVIDILFQGENVLFSVVELRKSIVFKTK